VFRAWARRAPERSLTIVRPTVVFGPWQPGQRPSAPATDRARPLDRDRRRAQLEIDGLRRQSRRIPDARPRVCPGQSPLQLCRQAGPRYEWPGRSRQPDARPWPAGAHSLCLGHGRWRGGRLAGPADRASLCDQQRPGPEVRREHQVRRPADREHRVHPRHFLRDAVVATIRHEFPDRFLQGLPRQDPFLARRLDR
jgi:hypothetical protein